MIFHENRLLADDSHEISYIIFSKIRKDIAKFVVCCSHDLHWYILVVVEMLEIKQFHDNSHQMENLILFKYEKFEVW